MSNLKHKISYRIMALFMALLMIVSLIPTNVIANAMNTEESPYKAKNFTAVYNAETDSIDMTWDAFETEPYELWLCVNSVKNTQLDVTATSCSYPESAGGWKDYSLLAFVDEEDAEGVQSEKINVAGAYTLLSISAFDAVEVENNLTTNEIIAKLPTQAKVLTNATNNYAEYGNEVQWNAESANYDQSISEEQTITISGVVVLDTKNVQNRNNIPLDCSIEVKVKAAVDVSLTSDLDDTAPVEKKVGESLALSVEANGTAPTYQWYKKAAEETEGTAIDGETAATLNISSLALTDAAQYYCVITGKNNSTVTSEIATVNVAKNDVDLQLSISPVNGQTRPNPIDIEVLNVPADAKGTIQVLQGTTLVKTFELNGENGKIKCSFVAYGENNSYEFSATYSGDNDKYNSDEVTGIAYDFTKGRINITEINNIPDDVKALDEFTVTPVSELDPTSNTVVKYTYAVSDPSIAKIDENGKVTTLKQGEFKITVTALGNDDYNGDVFESEVIVVDYAVRSGLSFNEDTVTKMYYKDFVYNGMSYNDTSAGAGNFVYSIVSAPSNYILIDQNGKIYYSDEVNPFDKDLRDLIGDVVVKLTKQTDGIYEEISDTYTLTITQAEQNALKFAQSSVEVTYVADAKGVAQTTTQNVATGGSVNADVVYSTENNDIITLNSATGEFTAIKPGTATVKAEIIGNTFYKKVWATYTITVKKGTVEGFGFDETKVEKLTTQYGVSFTNRAGVKENNKFGQVNSSETIKYEIIAVTEAIKDYVKVDATGVVYFDGSYALATDASEYSVTIQATKAENEYYIACPVVYTLNITRADVDATKDFLVNGNVIKDAKLLTNPHGWYNAENYDKDKDDIVITPDGTNYTEISSDGKTWSAQIGFDEDKKHDISFYLKDANGAVSFLTSQSINYDKTTATAKLTVVDDGNFWEKFLETITFGLWKKESKQIKIEAEDNLSGIMSIEYYEQNSNFQNVTSEVSIEDIVKDFEWKLCEISRGGLKASDTIDITLAELTNKKVVVYAKVTDYAGNVSYFRTDGMVFDNVTPKQDTELPEPIIKIELDESTKEGLYNGEVDFKLTVNDDQTDAVASGIKDITVTIKGSAAEEYEKVITVVAKDSEISSFDSSNVDADEFTVNGTFTVPADFDSNYLTINVVVNDYAGNTYNNEVPAKLAIDVTDPVIKVSYNDTEDTFSNEKYIGNNKNRVATIDITELNFDNSAVVITVTQDGKAVDIKPNFTAVDGAVDENGDQIGWRMVIDYATLGEGDFTFDVAYTDKAKNANSGWTGDDVAVNKSFTIDNTKPVISVVITNDAVKNNKYFAADRTATVTIIERNFSKDYKFDWSGLTFSLDGATLTAPTPVITKNDDGTYERVYTIDFSAEGDYTFDVKYTDLADNFADTYACSSVSYKEFTVDKTAPVLDISGVTDKSANNGDVAPVITYSDVNFNKDAVSIVLSGINNGTVNYNGAYADANDGHGQTYTYANFEKVQKVDDIYTLTAKLTDMAGNETEKTITFSANRFGSVYDLTDVKDIISKYLQTEEDVVFTETNVDSLERDGIKIKLTKNGTPTDLVEGTDYTVEVTGGNGQWSVYKYTIKKALFADDGRYSISIYSKDAAGNVNENIDETKKAEISFGIDKTNPVIVPIDFESGVQYAVDLKTVSVEIKDNLVLEGVKIYLNGKEIEYKVEGETYTFDIPKSNSKQDVKIVAVDAAGNEEPIEIKDFLVNANIFVRWYNNTPLFVGSIIGVVVLALGITIFLVFFKKKKEEEN